METERMGLVCPLGGCVLPARPLAREAPFAMYRLRSESRSPLDGTVSYAPAWGGDEAGPEPLVVEISPRAARRGMPIAHLRGTVMVVESSAADLQRIEQALTSYGYRVVPVEDGHTALDWAESFRPQAIVLSCSLPDFDARDLLLWLRQTEHGQAARIVLIVDPGQPLSAEDRARASAIVERRTGIPALIAALMEEGLVASTAT
jgi:CheY-like chemotaxis protein